MFFYATIEGKRYPGNYVLWAKFELEGRHVLRTGVYLHRRGPLDGRFELLDRQDAMLRSLLVIHGKKQQFSSSLFRLEKSRFLRRNSSLTLGGNKSGSFASKNLTSSALLRPRGKLARYLHRVADTRRRKQGRANDKRSSMTYPWLARSKDRGHFASRCKEDRRNRKTCFFQHVAATLLTVTLMIYIYNTLLQLVRVARTRRIRHAKPTCSPLDSNAPCDRPTRQRPCARELGTRERRTCII